MGTRGLKGVRVKGQDFLIFNKMDSYPEALGIEILAKVKSVEFLDSCMNNNELNNDFIRDSLFCEWAYIINYDTKKFEIWKGFQKEYDENNRYGYGMVGGYAPCKMLIEFDFDDLPSPQNFVKIIEETIKNEKGNKIKKKLYDLEKKYNGKFKKEIFHIEKGGENIGKILIFPPTKVYDMNSIDSHYEFITVIKNESKNLKNDIAVILKEEGLI